MRCPFCKGYQNRVVDSRLTKEVNVIRRRRECLSCRRRFTTHERIDQPLPMVIKRDGRRESFNREKIFSGIQKACQKRPVSMTVIEDFVSKMEQEFWEYGEKEIKSSVIGEKVIKFLEELDEVAYVRFASVYRQFKDISEFMAEVKGLLKGREK